MLSALFLGALTTGQFQAPILRRDRSFEIEIVRDTAREGTVEHEASMSAFKEGDVVWRLHDLSYAPASEGLPSARIWYEGGEAYCPGGETQASISSGGGYQSQPPPLLEEIFARTEFPYRVKPQDLKEVKRSESGSIQTLQGDFGEYLVAFTFDGEHGNMLSDFSIRLVGKKPTMSSLPDDERYEFRKPKRFGGVWFATEATVKSKGEADRVFRVTRMAVTEAPGVTKPDWLAAMKTVLDRRFEPARTYNVSDLKRRFGASWPPTLEELYEYGKVQNP
jgi:hypothetical protein